MKIKFNIKNKSFEKIIFSYFELTDNKKNYRYKKKEILKKYDLTSGELSKIIKNNLNISQKKGKCECGNDIILETNTRDGYMDLIHKRDTRRHYFYEYINNYETLCDKCIKEKIETIKIQRQKEEYLRKKNKLLAQEEEEKKCNKLISIIKKDIIKDEFFFETNFFKYDFVLNGGFHKSSLNIIAGVPGVGKTSLILSIINNLIILNKKCHLITLESSEKEIRNRLISINNSIPLNIFNLDLENYNSYELEQIIKSYKTSSTKITSTPSITITKIEEIIKQNIKSGIYLFIIDDIQRIEIDKVNRKFAINREQEVSYNARYLKKIALKYDITIICTAQLNKNIYNRQDDNIPKIGDIRDSGVIEYEADTITFIYRPSMYYKNKENKSKNDKAYLLVEKNRFGKTDKIELKFDIDYAYFENTDKDNNFFLKLSSEKDTDKYIKMISEDDFDL